MQPLRLLCIRSTLAPAFGASAADFVASVVHVTLAFSIDCGATLVALELLLFTLLWFVRRVSSLNSQQCLTFSIFILVLQCMYNDLQLSFALVHAAASAFRERKSHVFCFSFRCPSRRSREWHRLSFHILLHRPLRLHSSSYSYSSPLASHWWPFLSRSPSYSPRSLL